ncbi:Ig-like domain-containing protein [Candidatus Uhrbacteria bacterium]|nr:Ig-like domain-containing protein [Candidatus Uhrbacteria bacterium]
MKLFWFSFLIFFATSVPAHAANFDPNFSTIGSNKPSVKADGIDSARISITVKNEFLGAMPDVPVILQSSRGTLDEITPETANTTITGRAQFEIRSLKNGTSTLTALVNGQPLGKSVDVRFENGIALLLNVGDLVKIPDDGDLSTQPDTAVYYYASNGKRYVFPNEKVYFSWYPQFSNIKVIPLDQMSLIPIGGNITYRPGSRLVKFQSDSKTYLPTKGGVLRWVQSEDVVRNWFGSDWNREVDDISEAFYVNYKFGEPIGSSLDVSLDIIRSSVSSINGHLGFGNP